MISSLDPNLSKKFRDKVHDHGEFVRLYFHELNGKDIWSKICSCMDWLDVSIHGLELPSHHESMNITSLRFTHFIVTIDMIYESITNLWTSFEEVTDFKYPYKYDSSIFNANEYGENLYDDDYFKLIRAWFGIHAVNGNKVNIQGYPNNLRFFTSWSTSFDRNEFSLQLYSNNKSAEKQYGGTKKIDVREIIKFIELRYYTLHDLINIVDELYIQEKQSLQQTPIRLDKSQTHLEQIQYLYSKAQERKLTSEYFQHHIELYISFLKCDLDNFSFKDKELVLRYLYELKEIIPAYKKIVEEVNVADPPHIFSLMDLRSQVYSANRYEFSKILDYVETSSLGLGNYQTYIFSLKILIKKGLLPYYSASLSGEALVLLIYSLDHKWAKEQSTNILHNSLTKKGTTIDDLRNLLD
ncbi:hypothetical protein [Salsuginibacillus kocurii]|uniref:hypothetical protein n=1 Tax=Salsuginibacillus kocurii TaxID=427078 RepID=UPI000366E7FA|nr:hypothetical protein [Salsuginibacillus kocurii]